MNNPEEEKQDINQEMNQNEMQVDDPASVESSDMSSTDGDVDTSAQTMPAEQPADTTTEQEEGVSGEKKEVSSLSKTSDIKNSELDKEEGKGFLEKVITINRITKVTKGGKKLSFSALVVVGDMAGRVGYSLSKAPEVATAIRKAMTTAKKNMIKVPIRGTTIPHEIIGRCGGARVLMKPAAEGTGVIACGAVRAVCDGAGIHNILTKCHRSNNPINVVKAAIDGLSRLKPFPEMEQKDKKKEE